jgi:hypothetical protein
MIDRIKGQGRSPRDSSRALMWKNVSGETIPAYGVVKLRAFVDADGYFEGVKPDGDGTLHFVNGPSPVAVDAMGGSLMWDVSRLGLTDAAFGDTVGPTDGSWEMTTEGSGWTVFSTPENGSAALLRDGGGGGSGGGHTIWFTIEEVLCPETDYVAETTLVVTPTWYNRSCTGIPPGAEYGGEYHVYDLCNYLYGLATSDLVGTTGRASYMYPLTGACEPKWIIDDLCAQPEC